MPAIPVPPWARQTQGRMRLGSACCPQPHCLHTASSQRLMCLEAEPARSGQSACPHALTCGKPPHDHAGTCMTHVHWHSLPPATYRGRSQAACIYDCSQKPQQHNQQYSSIVCCQVLSADEHVVADAQQSPHVRAMANAFSCYSCMQAGPCINSVALS